LKKPLQKRASAFSQLRIDPTVGSISEDGEHAPA
jgi:hypothetical protein